MKRNLILIAVISILTISCNKGNINYDASGTFESVETIISAEATGVLKSFTIEEGQILKAGDHIGYIDSTQLYLKLKQLQSQEKAVLSRRPDIATQIAALKVQQAQAIHEQQRVVNLVKSEAATQKQLDDANAQVAIINKQISAIQSSLGITSSSIGEEAKPIAAQMEQLYDQLSKCVLVNPMNGTVLVKYAQANEMAVAGKPLYKIADLSSLILRAYITGDQFAKVKLGQQVTVLIDDGSGASKKYNGIVEWISSKAEFTPKTIQTKDERANLVYASKIKVLNDGFLKIGMYGEVKF